MIESEGITENVKTWRTDVAAKIVNALSVQKSCLKPQNQKFLHGTSKTMALK
jgi:phosphosulfolactate synthase (CoM biosynthesis protein A)